jgi:hypothetical protein
MAFKYVTAGITKLAGKRLGKRLTAKQLRAARKNIQKAIAASARKRAKAIGGVAKSPLKSYAGSVTKRTLARRARNATRISNTIKTLKSSNIKLSKTLTEQSRQLAVTKGSKAQSMITAAAQSQQLSQVRDKLLKKGDKGVIGFFRKQKLNRITSDLKLVNDQLSADRSVISRLSKQVAITDGRINLQQGNINSLTNKYLKLTAPASIGSKAKTVGRDIVTTAAISGTGYAGIKTYKNKKRS